MSYTIWKTLDTTKGRKEHYVWFDEEQTYTMVVVTSADATQADIDAIIDSIKQNEIEVAALKKEEEDAAAYAAEHGNG